MIPDHTIACQIFILRYYSLQRFLFVAFYVMPRGYYDGGIDTVSIGGVMDFLRCKTLTTKKSWVERLFAKTWRYLFRKCVRVFDPDFEFYGERNKNG